jgi:hypothetical protein
MKHEDYEAMLKLTSWVQEDYEVMPTLSLWAEYDGGNILDPTFLEHAKGCRLSEEDCETCRKGSFEFKERYLDVGAKMKMEPLPLRAKLRQLYMRIRYWILFRLWLLSGRYGEPPDYWEPIERFIERHATRENQLPKE